MSLNWNTLDEQWRNRHDAEHFAALEGALDKALYNQGDKPEYAVLWRWARLSHFRAMQAMNGEDDQAAGKAKSKAKSEVADKAAARRHFAAGAQEALQAARLQPNRVEGHFWFGVNHIEAARAGGKVAAARALSLATRHIERAAQIDETYHFAGPLRVLGRLTHLRPLLLGGSLDHALDIYRRALQIAPDNSTTLLYYAEALVADRQPGEARRVLNRLIAAAPDPDWIWEQTRDKILARALLQKMNE